ncbi:MAG: hypothetical protein MUO99_07185 [Dehalococcoidales bacterium]|nr:hypothetical protein [Dehalococcoidales bacterium]
MGRLEISEEQLKKIAGLHALGKSWSQIGKDTGIPRRSAKAAYERWSKGQLSDELKAVRVSVAKEQLKEHFDNLITFADYLVNNLTTPTSIEDKRPAETYLKRLFQKKIINGDAAGEPIIWIKTPSPRELRRCQEQNKLLRDCLKTHTSGIVPLESLLNDWKHGWDSCIAHTGNLRELVNTKLGNYVKLDKDIYLDIQRFIVNRSDATKYTERLAKEITRVLWEAILNYDYGADAKSVQSIKPSSFFVEKWAGQESNYRVLANIEYRVLVGVDGKQVLSLSGSNNDEVKKRAAIVAKWCNNTIENVLKADMDDKLIPIKNDIIEIENAITALGRHLDNLKLKPILLRTRCEICPT